jgi:hypothetical protein
MTPAQRHEWHKTIARRVTWGILVFSVLTLNPFGVAGMWILLKFIEPDLHVPPYKKPTFRGKVTYDPRVDRPPEATPVRQIEREHKDIEF